MTVQKINQYIVITTTRSASHAPIERRIPASSLHEALTIYNSELRNGSANEVRVQTARGLVIIVAS